LAKGNNNGWLDAKTFGPVAARGYAGTLQEFVAADASGALHLNGVCKVAGLGGTPYRDGSYDYYVGAEVIADDPKGVGAFILAGAELRP
jgi:unsaturated rhamnogalacturonyl hydrolase